MEQPEKNDGLKKEIFSWLRTIVLTIVITLLFCQFVARPSRVDGRSMENTFYNNDMVILWELNYKPQRGDVIVCNSKNPLNENLIKRVIALPGDRITVRNGTVTVNGEQLDEPYVKEAVWSGYNVQMTVPEGKIFLMGDNRNNSADSRMIGPVDASAIIGKAVFRFFPFDRFGSVS